MIKFKKHNIQKFILFSIGPFFQLLPTLFIFLGYPVLQTAIFFGLFYMVVFVIMSLCVRIYVFIYNRSYLNINNKKKATLFVMRMEYLKRALVYFSIAKASYALIIVFLSITYNPHLLSLHFGKEIKRELSLLILSLLGFIGLYLPIIYKYYYNMQWSMFYFVNKNLNLMEIQKKTNTVASKINVTKDILFAFINFGIIALNIVIKK